MNRTTTMLAGFSLALTPFAVAQDVADVRVFHASPDAPAVDVLVDGAPVFTDLAFSEFTGTASLFEGNYNLQVVVAGTATAVIDVDLDLEAGVDYSILALNDVANIAPFILIDDNTIDEENARVRFFHASPDAPNVDIFVTGGPELFDNIPYLGTGDYLPVGPGTYDLEVRVADTDTVVLNVPGVQLDAGGVYTIVAEGFAFGEPTLQAVLSVDNKLGDLMVGAPFPGIANGFNALRARGARPGTQVFFAGSTSLGSTGLPVCGGLALDLANPALIGSARADEKGEAVAIRFIPNISQDVFFQALNLPDCTLSPVETFQF